MNTERINSLLSQLMGENAFLIENVNSDNVLEYRQRMLLNVAYNGKRSNKLIIEVLQYMQQFCD
jgi:hypothetical protein